MCHDDRDLLNPVQQEPNHPEQGQQTNGSEDQCCYSMLALKNAMKEACKSKQSSYIKVQEGSNRVAGLIAKATPGLIAEVLPPD